MPIRRTLLLLAVLLTLSSCRPGTIPRDERGTANKTAPADPSAPAHPSAVRPVRVAAAADLQFALKEVIADFEREHPEIHVETTIGASGNFFALLSNGAPFDVFLSADSEYPKKLVQAGKADGSTEFAYAVGQIVLWAPKTSPVDIERLGIQSLFAPSVKKIAIANPQFAPYGRAAEAALKSLGVYERVKERLVLGENIAQTTHFVVSGAADVGLIADSLALAPSMKGKGRAWIVPQSAYPKLKQAGVVLRWARDREAAVSFCQFLRGTRGQAILARYGFAPPDDSPKGT